MSIDEMFDIGDNELPVLKPIARTLKIFRDIIEEDKGSKGDSDGRKKLLAIKQIAYIYFSLSKRYFQNYGEESRERAILRKLGFPDNYEPTYLMKVAYKELKNDTQTITEKVLNTCLSVLHEHNDIYSNISKRNRALLASVESMVLTTPDGQVNQTAITTQRTALESLEANALKVARMVNELPKQLEVIKQLELKFVKELNDAKKRNGAVTSNKWEDDDN